MLKAIVSYSKKVPVPGADFSSQGYSLSLETEVLATDPAAIQAALHDNFELVKATVEKELANGNGNGHATAKTQENGTQPVQRPAGNNGRGNGQQNGNGRRISNAQAKFCLDLARKAGLKLVDLDQIVRDEYGPNGLYELGAGQASSLIETLKARQAA
jgi:hypothetical protein